MQEYNTKEYEQVNQQFEEFLHTKGLSNKFKLAFHHMGQNAHEQRESDKASFEEVRKQSVQSNAEFTEFLHTKGIKAKIKLVIENIKKGAKDSKNIANKGYNPMTRTYSVEELSVEFNQFLKQKGLDDRYIVEVVQRTKE